MSRSLPWCWAGALAVLLGACAPDPDKPTTTEDSVDIVDPELESFVLAMSPLPELPADPTNRWADDDTAAHLGQWLFFDTRLSASGRFSCATCHDPALGFGDGLPLSEAAGTTDRHAPTLYNVGLHRWQFWDGRCDTLWCQAAGPIEHDKELALPRTTLARTLADAEDLRLAYEELFGALPDLSDTERFPVDARPVPDDPDDPRGLAWDGMEPADQAAVTAVMVNITKAIAAYERRLLTGRAPIDDFVDALDAGDAAAADGALSAEARAGLELFAGEGGCVFCHSGGAFTNFEFHNLALPTPDWLTGLDAGRYDGIDSLLASELNAAGPWSDDPEGEQAARLGRIAQTAEQLAQFKVPGLRRVASSAPYFHGGHMDTLEDVVRFYSEAPETDAVGHREEMLVPLGWSDDEIDAVVAFLTEGLGADAPPAELLEPPASPLP